MTGIYQNSMLKLCRVVFIFKKPILTVQLCQGESCMYTINITGHHVDVTPALKEHINEKMDKLGRLSDQITTIHVTLMQDNNEQKAEATIHLPGKELFAAAVSENRLFHAIDAMTEKLARQIDKHKTRKSANHQKPMVAS